MKSVQGKSVRYALGLVLALACVAVVALPMLAAAGEVNQSKELGGTDIPMDVAASNADYGADQLADARLGAQAVTAEQLQELVNQAKDAMNGVVRSDDGNGLDVGARYVFSETYDTLERNIAEVDRFLAAPDSENYGEWYESLSGYLNAFNEAIQTKSAENNQPSGPDVVDTNDISHGSFYYDLNQLLTVSSSGEVEEPKFNGSYYDGSSERRLVQNKDFKIIRYRSVATGQEMKKLTEPGQYVAIVEGIAPYTGQAESVAFWVYDKSYLQLSEARCDPEYYAYTGDVVTPTVTVTLDGVTLTQGVDYRIHITQNQGGRDVEVLPVEQGRYNVTIKAIEGGKYAGEVDAHFSIVSPNNLAFATITDASGSNRATYAWNNGEPVVPNVIVTAADGVTVLEEGVHYDLMYQRVLDNDYDPNHITENTSRFAAVTDEGAYWVYAVAKQGGGYAGECRSTFYVAKSENDLTRAVITPNTPPNPLVLQYTGESLQDAVDQATTVTLDGEQLKSGEHYRVAVPAGRHGRDISGVPGMHTAHIIGSASANVSGKYYGVIDRPYFVATADAPAPNVREDLATGVKAAGALISSLSTNQEEGWVTLESAKPTGAAIEQEAQAVLKAAEAAGAKNVQVFDVKLAFVQTGEDGAQTSQNLTESLDGLTLSFPVDAQYNGMTATITQIHDGKALPAKTATVSNGAVSTDVDSLSQFVIVVSDNQDSQASPAATKPTKSDLANTGDMVLSTAVCGLIVVAMAAAGALVLSRRRSER